MACINLSDKKRRQLKSLGKAMLASEGIRNYLVLYQVRDNEGHMREHKSPWFKSRERATHALRLISNRYGAHNAIMFID